MLVIAYNAGFLFHVLRRSRIFSSAFNFLSDFIQFTSILCTFYSVFARKIGLVLVPVFVRERPVTFVVVLFFAHENNIAVFEDPHNIN